MVRGMNAEKALDTLRFVPNRSAEPVFKVIQSAIANAEQNYGLEMDDLYISKIFVDDGPRHRLRPYGGRFGSRGRFKPIIKRSCHITVILAERELVE
jgi:large subunit ribosomal protein L22